VIVLRSDWPSPLLFSLIGSEAGHQCRSLSDWQPEAHQLLSVRYATHITHIYVFIHEQTTVKVQSLRINPPVSQIATKISKKLLVCSDIEVSWFVQLLKYSAGLCVLGDDTLQ